MLVEKHKSFAEKAEHDKTKLVDAHATEFTKLHADLDLETRSYTEYPPGCAPLASRASRSSSFII
jgi:hypothetical protein